MPVGDRDAETLRRDGRGCGAYDAVALNVPPELEWLLLGLFFLAANEGNDVVDHLRPCFKRFSCAGDRLIGADERPVDAEFHERMQRRNVALQAAIGLDGDETAPCAETAALGVEDADVLGVDLRHDHRHIRRPAVGGIVGDNGALQPCIALLQFTDLVLPHVHSAENKIDHRGKPLCVGDCVENGHIRRHGRDGLRHVPLRGNGIAIWLARAVCAGGERRQLEPRVAGHEKKKALTDHAGRADDPDFVLFHMISSQMRHFRQKLRLNVTPE